MKSTRLGAAALALALLFAGSACQADHKDPATVARIILVGDSLAHGVYAYPGIKKYLPEFFPHAEVRFAGGPSTSPMDSFDPATGASDWANQVAAILASGFDADLIVIEGCCNRFTTQDAWHQALGALIAKGRQSDPGGDRRVVLVTTQRIVPGSAPYYESYGVPAMLNGSNAAIRDTADVAIADIDFDWSVNWQPVLDVPGVGVTRLADGLHFTDAGAREAARIVSLT